MVLKPGRMIQANAGPGVNVAFDVFEPDPGLITISGIAETLANLCRFGGHCRPFYSVAQHCYHVSYLADPVDALEGLLHDASEAYLVDIPRPLKISGMFDEYLKIEETLQAVINQKFGLPIKMSPSVQRADDVMLATERRDFMQPIIEEIWAPLPEPNASPIFPWNPDNALQAFMRRFEMLTQ